jgi:hypothetical protein
MEGVMFLDEVIDDGLMLLKAPAVLNQLCTKLQDHVQGLQVVAADLAGHIARAAGVALINDVQDPVRVPAPPLQKGLSNGISPPCGITHELGIGDAGASF